MFCNLCIYCSCTICVSYNQMGTKGAAVFLVRHLCFSTMRQHNAMGFHGEAGTLRMEAATRSTGSWSFRPGPTDCSLALCINVFVPLHRVLQGRTRPLPASDDLNISMVFPCPIVGPALVPCSRRRRRSYQSLSAASIVRTAAGVMDAASARGRAHPR
jgi:hypothetical protein